MQYLKSCRFYHTKSIVSVNKHSLQCGYYFFEGDCVRFLPVVLVLAASLCAAPKDLSSYHAKFEQSITDEHGKIIRYSGELWASKPQNALWVYQKPIAKSVYITGRQVTVIEPQIEQVTLRSLDGDIDFLQIIQGARKIDENRYVATVKGQRYDITFKNDVLFSIAYTDGFDNKVLIRFIDPVQNRPIDPSRFKTLIPSDYDVIKG